MRLPLGLGDSLRMPFLGSAKMMNLKWNSKDRANQLDSLRCHSAGLSVCGLSRSQNPLGAIEARPKPTRSSKDSRPDVISAAGQGWQNCDYSWPICAAFASGDAADQG